MPPVFGSANFAKRARKVEVLMMRNGTFDLSNFYGYNSISLIESGLEPEIIKVHPSAWFCSRSKCLWRICNVMNNLCRHAKIRKPREMLFSEITNLASRYPNSFVGLHDFCSSKYMSQLEVTVFCKRLVDGGVKKSRLIICETDKLGCFAYYDYIVNSNPKPLYCFGKSNFPGAIRILNYFKT